MEPTVLSSPFGHTQWEAEQPFPLGFEILDSGDEAVLCQSGQTGLDFRKGDQSETVQQSEKEKVFVDKPVELENLINASTFSCGNLQLLEGHTISQTRMQDLSCTEKTEGLDEIGDFTLSWLFSPDLVDVIGKTSACKELTLTQDSPLESSDVLISQAEQMSLNIPLSSFKISESNSESHTSDQFLLVDFSNDNSCLPQRSSGELNPQGVTEELVDLPREEPAGLPPAQSRKTLSPETRHKGLFPDQVTDLPITSHTTLQGLSETCLPHNHTSQLQECFEGSVPLLDLEVPDFDSSVSLCPVGFASVCPGAPLDLSAKESEVAQATVIGNLPSEQQSENDSLALCLSEQPSILTLPLAQDACIQEDLTSESNSSENISEDLMEVCPEEKRQGHVTMALDLNLTVEEAHDDESWDLKPQEGVQNGSVVSPTDEQAEEERLTHTNQLEDSDCHEVASLDFSVQDINASPETGWTSEQDVVTTSLSKMVVDDSLPVVSAVNTREEDVSPLKAVFDALDQDGDGFVRIEEFMEFAAAYGADQVRCLVLLCYGFFF